MSWRHNRHDMKPPPRMNDIFGCVEDAYEAASRRRDELAKEINDTQQRIEALRIELRSTDTFLDQWRKFAGLERAEPPMAIAHLAVQHRPKNPKKEDVVEASRRIVSEHGSPLGRSELYKKLGERGIVLNGSDPEMVLSTMLWRSKERIIRLPRCGYWMTERPYPIARYSPGRPIAEDDEEQAMMAAGSEDLLSEHS
jgi:hypothetical protein